MGEDNISLELNKEFIKTQNLEKLDNQYYKDYSGTEKDEEIFRVEQLATIEELDVGEDGVLLSISGDFGNMVVNYMPKQNTLIGLVEEQDNLDSDILIRVTELVVKKLNKFKSLIESIKGI